MALSYARQQLSMADDDSNSMQKQQQRATATTASNGIDSEQQRATATTTSDGSERCHKTNGGYMDGGNKKAPLNKEKAGSKVF